MSFIKKSKIRRKINAKSADCKRWTTAGAFGIIGGFIFALSGVSILTITESDVILSLSLQKFATTLALLTIPLLILGSFCLNKAESRAVSKRNFG